MADYYTILGISRQAHQFEVRRAFREKAKSLHPDLNPDSKAHDEFKLINEAYQVLIDSNKRQLYDLRLQNGVPSRRKVYHRPGNVRYRARGDHYAHYESQEQAGGTMEKIEKYFDLVLFVSLLLVGCYSLAYGIYRLLFLPDDEISPVPGIAMGIFFTALLIFIWNMKKRNKE